jgi:hypothetical protein
MKNGLKLESTKVAKQKIDNAIADQINTSIKKNKSLVISKLKKYVEIWIRSQPEIISLSNENTPGSLNSQLGLRSGSASSAVTAIVQAVVNSIKINLTKVDKKLKGGVEFSFQSKNFANLLTLSAGVTVTEKGQSLPWLNWLLTQGDSIIIVGYKYEAGSGGRSGGRSGGGKMTTGSSFRIPPKYSGNTTNNFITRALSNRNTEIKNLLMRLFS